VRGLRVDRVAELGGVAGVAREVALLPVVAVLGHVVHDEGGRLLEQVLGEARVEVDRTRHRRVREVPAPDRPVGRAHDRGARDDRVRAAADLARDGGHAGLELRMRRGKRLRSLRMPVEQDGPAELRKDLLGELEVNAALAPAAEDPDRIDVALRERADPEHAGGRGAHLRDPGRVHHGERPAGGGVGQHEQAVEVGQAELLVAGVAGDPLEPDRVSLGQVRGHRVDEGVLARVHADLRRHLDRARPLCAEDLVEDLDHVRAGQGHGLDVRAAQVADAVAGHRRSLLLFGRLYPS
jgi:hypothetical protein